MPGVIADLLVMTPDLVQDFQGKVFRATFQSLGELCDPESNMESVRASAVQYQRRAWRPFIWPANLAVTELRCTVNLSLWVFRETRIVARHSFSSARLLPSEAEKNMKLL